MNNHQKHSCVCVCVFLLLFFLKDTFSLLAQADNLSDSFTKEISHIVTIIPEQFSSHVIICNNC